MHVQSRSHWAPSNIGSYSQAVKVCAVDNGNLDLINVLQFGTSVIISGQIGLQPATMQLVSDSLEQVVVVPLINWLLTRLARTHWR